MHKRKEFGKRIKLTSPVSIYEVGSTFTIVSDKKHDFELNLIGIGETFLEDETGKVVKITLTNVGSGYSWANIVINGDGLQTRDFVYVGDVVKANVLSMLSDVKHAFINVGTGKSISVLELANIIVKYSGLPIKPIHGPELKGDVKATRSDNTLIKKLLKWEPYDVLEEWLERTLKDIMKNS